MNLSSLLPQVEPHPKPIWRVTVDGKDVSAVLTDRLISLTHTDNRGFEADTLELQLDDTDGQLDLPPRGAEIKFALGWESTGLIDKGGYTVDEVEHNGAPDTLSIRARSADLRSGLTTQRERSWHDVTLGAIVRTIADENDLKPMIADALANQHIDHIDQTNETAVNLLSRLAKQFDAIATVKDGRLLFIAAGGGVSASGKPLPPVLITRETGDQHRFAIADREAFTAVRALYHDVGAGVKGEVIWGKTEDSAERKQPATTTPAPTATGQYKDSGKTHKSRDAARRAARKQWRAMQTNKAQRAAWIGVKAKYNNRNLGVSGEVAWGQADEDKLRKNAKKTAAKDAEKFGAPKAPAAPAIDHSADNIKVLRHVYSSKANAQRAARAEWRRLQRGMATFSLTLCRGRPELFPEVPTTVAGYKPAIDSTEWIITRVVNTLGDGGFTTQIELEIKATEIPG